MKHYTDEKLRELIESYRVLLKDYNAHADNVAKILEDAEEQTKQVKKALWDLTNEALNRDMDIPDDLYTSS